MAVAMTDTVINYSGLLHTKTNNSTRLLNAVYSRGRTTGEGIIGTGVKRVNSIEFALSSDYSIPGRAYGNRYYPRPEKELRADFP